MAKPPRSQRSIEAEKAEQRRRGTYLRSMAAQRAAVAGKAGGAAEREQAEAYRTLGIDLKVGFDGRPPALRISHREKSDDGEVLVHARNIARDPIHILRTQGFLSGRQHTAAVALANLFEQHASIGLRGMAFAEAIDGGKMPDVSTHALAVARRMAEWRRSFSEVDRGLLTAVTIDGQTISHLARAGTFGKSRNTVRDRLSAALERLADHFGVK